MREMKGVGHLALIGFAAAAVAAIHGTRAPTRAAEQPFASARACLKAVNEAEERLTADEKASPRLKEMLSRAQDYCIQTRYERAAELLSEAKQQAADAAE